MSFTVIHHKNGKAIPIKLSIWDALKGSSEAKELKESKVMAVGWRRIKPAQPEFEKCPCCDKNHIEVKPSANAIRKNESKPDDKKKSNNNQPSNDNSKNNHPNRDEETYSAKDDAKIIEMKEANESWKQILAAVNKSSLSQLKDHWKIINPENANDKKKDAKHKDTKQAKIDRQKAEGEAKRKERQSQGANQHADGDKYESQSKYQNSKNAAVADKSDELKSYALRYDKQKWLAAASRHYDLTGQRISAEMAQKMVEGDR